MSKVGTSLKKVFFLLIIIGLASCGVDDSGDVNQDKIFCSYELFYDQNTDKTTAIAQFRFASETGALLELNESASITFNGQEMQYDQFYLGHSFEMNGLVDSGAFVYSDLDQLVFANVISSLDPIGFPGGFDTVSKSENNPVVWIGSALDSNEVIGLYFDSWDWESVPFITQSSDSAIKIVIRQADIETVSLGHRTLIMQRWSESPVSEGTSKGGIVVGRYQTANRNVQIVN